MGYKANNKHLASFPNAKAVPEFTAVRTADIGLAPRFNALRAKSKAKVGTLTKVQTACIARDPNNPNKAAVSQMTGINWKNYGTNGNKEYMAVADVTGQSTTELGEVFGAHYTFKKDAAAARCACTLPTGARCHYTTQANKGHGVHTSFCCTNGAAHEPNGPAATNTDFTADIAKICGCM